MEKLKELRDAWLDMLISLSSRETIAIIAVLVLWQIGAFGDSVSLEEAIIAGGPVMAFILGNQYTKAAKAKSGRPVTLEEARALSNIRVEELKKVEAELGPINPAPGARNRYPIGVVVAREGIVPGYDAPLPEDRSIAP